MKSDKNKYNNFFSTVYFDNKIIIYNFLCCKIIIIVTKNLLILRINFTRILRTCYKIL